MTADGKLASGDRHIASPGSRRDQQHMLELRTRADAVMTGARTADLRSVHLGPGGAGYRRRRLNRGLAEHNLRVIVSGSGTVNPKADIFKKRFSPILILTTDRITTARRKSLEQVADEVKICGRDELDFESALGWLSKKWNVRRLLSEGSGSINDPLFRAGLVDELHLTICPLIFGGRDAPTLSDGAGVERLAEAYQMKLKSMKRVGQELYLVYRSRP